MESGQSDLGSDIVRVTVPGSLEYIRIVRLATSGVASRLGFDVEEIEDLRVAVDELASVAIEHARTSELEITFRTEGDLLRIDGCARTTQSSTGVTNGSVKIGDLTEQILKAVVDRHEVTVVDGQVRFCCTRRLPTA